jgi:hypothetical protein
MTPELILNVSNYNWKQNVYYRLWYMPCVSGGHITSDPRTNMFIVTKAMGFWLGPTFGRQGYNIKIDYRV